MRPSHALRKLLAAALLCMVAAAWSRPAVEVRAETGADNLPANRAMTARLKAIYAATDWRSDPNKPMQRAHYLQAALASGKLTPEQQHMVLPQIADQLLQAGDPNGALGALDQFAQLATLSPAETHLLRERRGLAFLRLGEQENCLNMRGMRACVFPLRASAVHRLPRGAQGAIEEYTWLLQHDPRDALSRWLLNLAYMQLGQWPGKVPAAYLLPAKLFASEHEPGEFLDYASLAGADTVGRAGGAAVEDFDGDGRLDIVTSSSGPLDPMHLLHSNGDGTFSDWTERAGLAGELGGLNLVLTDYDNDGHPDLLVLRGGWWGRYGRYPVSLLHNRGDGTFEDVTERAGLMLPANFAPTQTAAWADFDGDGRLDLFIPHESTEDDPHPAMLFHNNGDGTFTDVAPAVHLDSQGFVKGVAWGDFNNDGRPDLYVSTHDGHNRLYRNDGPAPGFPDAAHWRFTEVTAQAGLGNPGPTFATWFFDYNNDGWPDLFVAGYWADSMQDVGRFEAGEPFRAGVPHLYRNNRDGTFTDIAAALHLDRAIMTMGSNFGDLDNDGWPDVYLGTGEPSFQALLPNRMFRNAAAQRFEDVTTSGGFGHLQKGHAVAFADIENRGVDDIFEEMGGAYPGDPYQAALYRNPGSAAGRSVTVRLAGTASNRAGYGARLEAVFREAPGRPARHVFLFPGSVSSFGASPLQQLIGIGAATKIGELHVRWPANPGKEQIFRNLAAGRSYMLREDATGAIEIQHRPFNLGQASPHPDTMHGISLPR